MISGGQTGEGSQGKSGPAACPRCGYALTGGANECPRCGVLLSKAHGRDTKRPKKFQIIRDSDAESGSNLFGWLAVAVLLGGAWWLWPRSAGRDILPSRPTEGTRTAPTAVVGRAAQGAVAGTSAPSYQLPAVRSGGSWYEGAAGLEQALAEARGGGFPVAIYFYEDGSAECRQVRRELLDAHGVTDLLRGFVKVQVNPDSGPEERAAAEAYGVRRVPAIYVLPRADLPPRELSRWQTDVNGNERLRTPDEMVAVFRAALGG